MFQHTSSFGFSLRASKSFDKKSVRFNSQRESDNSKTKIFFVKLIENNSASKYPLNSPGLQYSFNREDYSEFLPINPRVNQEQQILTEYEVQGMLEKGAIHQAQSTLC